MKYHFIGIGGAGMGPLASILLARGQEVSGSDKNKSEMTDALEGQGAKVFVGHNAENISSDIDLVVVTVAIPQDNPELMRAKEINKKIIKRSELLGELMLEGKGLAISGTHGKTTTSSLLAWALTVARTDPTAVIGGNIQNFGSSFLAGKGEYFVAEACEYYRAFLDIRPYGAIVTNIEADHLDYYKDLEEIVETFALFAGQVASGGFLVTNGDIDSCREMAGAAKAKVILVGFGEENDFRVSEVRVGVGGTSFVVAGRDGSKEEMLISLFGEHNALNCAMVYAAFRFLGLEIDRLKEAFKTFKGAKRRLELISQDPLIYDDYGHHPTEIEATLKTVREMYPHKKVCCIFEPHQYSRTHFFLDDFAKALSLAETVVIPGIYEARDTQADKEKVNASVLASHVSQAGSQGIYLEGNDNVAEFVLENHKDDVILTMGAGNVWQIAYKIKERSFL